LGESLCRIYSDLYGLNTIILRYFNVFGKNSNISEYSSVLNKFFDLYKKNEPLLVNGGQQTRDFIHVEDVVDCNIKCAEFTSSGNLTYNVGTGKSYTIDYIAKQISQNILYKDYRSIDILYSESNIDKIKKDLKWSPRIDIIKYINEEKNRIANHSYK
jgi:UDP-glucose 4-epimerase